MKDNRQYQLHADICRILTHPTRLQIIDLLRDDEKSVKQLADEMDISQGTVSRHLSSMRIKGVVVARREGTSIFYRLGSKRILAAYDEMHQFALEYFAAQKKLLEPA
ncbi:MAG: metalloregulator ArsR/SmtB family transcription factor [Candidatus Promineifilaceae bacterium]|nr:metalloregulator ArsR/SmtB family transcription factor [Candidatus Promineifilaceae bacterium]